MNLNNRKFFLVILLNILFAPKVTSHGYELGGLVEVRHIGSQESPALGDNNVLSSLGSIESGINNLNRLIDSVTEFDSASESDSRLVIDCYNNLYELLLRLERLGEFEDTQEFQNVVSLWKRCKDNLASKHDYPISPLRRTRLGTLGRRIDRLDYVGQVNRTLR